ncbi:MAG: hypothetical protein JNK65_09305, partial [Deltaproteobacteria bacterium]|nr:hypothetical protein [Deltaproteobacteria bacterium]
MSDPVKPAATGSAQPANPVVPPVQTTDKKEEGGTPTRFEAHVDGQGRIGDAFVVGAGAGFLAFPWLYAGGKFQSNFSTRPWSVAAEVGPRFKVGDTVSIQPTLVAGVQKVSGEETKQGPLAEKVKLDGINFFFNPQVRLLIEPVNPSGIGGFLAIGMHIEPRGGLDATPASLKSGENPTSNVLTPNFGIGITWGAKPKKASSPTEEPRKSEPEVSPDTKKQEPKKESFKEKVDSKTAAVTAGMDKDRAEKLKAQINKISEKVTRLKARITNMGEGINRSNQIVQSVDETTDTLVDFN